MIFTSVVHDFYNFEFYFNEKLKEKKTLQCDTK